MTTREPATEADTETTAGQRYHLDLYYGIGSRPVCITGDKERVDSSLWRTLFSGAPSNVNTGEGDYWKREAKITHDVEIPGTNGQRGRKVSYSAPRR
jgi:hypothetical protein